MKLPRLTPRWTLLLFGLLLAVGLLVPMPIRDRIANTLMDSLHGPAFAVLALLVCRVLARWSWPGPRRAAWFVCLSLIALGALTEVAQFCVGREFSLKDIAADSLGVVAGTLWAVSLARPPRCSPRVLRVWAIALLATAMAPMPLGLIDTVMQRRDFPVLSSFEHPLERLRWRTWWARVGRSREHVADGDWSLRVDLQPGEYSGIGTVNSIADWSGYRELVFDVALTEGPPLDGRVIIEDRSSRKTSDDRFERRFRLEPGHQQIVIPLADVERGPRDRPLDLTQVSLLLLSTANLEKPRTLFLDNVRLR